MAVMTLSSRDFNQGVSEAKRAATEGPVFITDRGKPAHVLMSIELYQRLTRGRQKIADLLAMPGVADIELDVQRSSELAQAADFS